MRRASLAGMPVDAALRRLMADFRGAGIETPGLDARLLVLHVTGLSHAALVSSPERPLAKNEAQRLAACAARRLAGEPVSRIIGRRAFFGRDFLITPDVLDPRPDSETLIEAALAVARLEEFCGRALRIADAGTGSGALIITLLAELPAAVGLGVDISFAALKVARENARRLGVSGRLVLAQSQWLAAAGGPFSLMVANPPYVAAGEIAGLAREVREHDPGLALDGGPDGLDPYRILAGQAAGLLRPGGFAIWEAGQGQAQDIVAICQEAGFAPDAALPVLWRDLGGVERAVVLRKK